MPVKGTMHSKPKPLCNVCSYPIVNPKLLRERLVGKSPDDLGGDVEEEDGGDKRDGKHNDDKWVTTTLSRISNREIIR